MAEGLKVPLYDVEKSFKPTTVCVTGATGYVAGAIVERLLAAGHTVHGTCRDPNKERSVGHLKKMEGAEERLKLFQADLLSDGSFEEAMKGCTCVMHTASPFVNVVPKGKAKEVLLDPAVQGTENVLNTVNATKSVTRVVLTSSCLAVYGDPDERGPDHIFSEEDWNTSATETDLPYSLSKRLAEEKAYEICKAQNRWTLCSINPGFILGPPNSPHASGESISFMKDFAGGKMWPAGPRMGLGLCDVRDVAAAHCVTMSNKDANGRYLIISGSYWVKEMANTLRKTHPKLSLPKMEVPKPIMSMLTGIIGFPRDQFRHFYGKVPRFDTSRAEALGMKFLDVGDILGDMVDKMTELGIMKAKN